MLLEVHNILKSTRSLISFPKGQVTTESILMDYSLTLREPTLMFFLRVNEYSNKNGLNCNLICLYRSLQQGVEFFSVTQTQLRLSA